MGSRKAAINAFCRDCIVDQNPGNGSALSQITKCASFTCKLHAFRPRVKPKLNRWRSTILARESVEKASSAILFDKKGRESA